MKHLSTILVVFELIFAATRSRLLKRACAALVASGLAVASVWAAPDPTQQFILRNGMTLIVKPDHRAPTAVHMLWVRVGSMDEVDGTSGVAHLLEHMLFKGTPTVKAGDFSRRVAALGGRENAFTNRDVTVYFQTLPKEKLALALELEADRMNNLQLKDESFAKEIQVVMEERRMRTEDNPQALVYEQLMGVA